MARMFDVHPASAHHRFRQSIPTRKSTCICLTIPTRCHQHLRQLLEVLLCTRHAPIAPLQRRDGGRYLSEMVYIPSEMGSIEAEERER